MFPGQVMRWRRPVPYDRGLQLQGELAERRRADLVPDTLLLLEHPHVYTLGRSADPSHILLPPHELERRGIGVYPIDRGGDVTYHGPGQLVGYPIFSLRSRGMGAHDYLRALEEVLIQALRTFGLEGVRVPGMTGVWVRGAKVAAIGVKISRGVTSHGFALNVCPDLSLFQGIIPCGLVGKPVTSMSVLLDRAVSVDEVVPAVQEAFASVFSVQWVRVDEVA